MKQDAQKNKRSQKQTKHKKTNRIHRDMTQINTLLTIICSITNLLVMIVLFNGTRFSALSTNLFALANVIVMILLLLMDFTLMNSIRTRYKKYYITSVVLLCVFFIFGSYGTYALTRVNMSLDKLTKQNQTQEITTYFVTYEGNENAPNDLNTIKDKIVGVTTSGMQSEFALKELEEKSISYQKKEFDDYQSEMNALLSKEIDCAVLPSNYENVFASEESFKSKLEETKVIAKISNSVKSENIVGIDKDLTKEPFTVLLIGTADELSDTMILCSVNPISMKVTMTSIARDSYVPITCYKNNYGKLNSARMVDRSCLIDTIEQLMNLKIDYFVDTNFKGMVDIVDALGGVTLNSPIEFVGQDSSDERGHFTVHVPAGENVRMNGEQALCFARERYKFPMGDFARQQHQQEVIQAMIKELMSTRDVNTFLNVLDAAGNNISTNLSIEQMTGFVSYAMNKANRYIDPAHLERVFDIEGWRITGKDDSAFSSGVRSYVYRLYEGAIEDSRKEILRNLDLDSAIEPMGDFTWSASDKQEKPLICKDVYDGNTASQKDLKLDNFVGKQINELEEYAKLHKVDLEIEKVEDKTKENGEILQQSHRVGTLMSPGMKLKVKVVENPEEKVEEEKKPEDVKTTEKPEKTPDPTVDSKKEQKVEEDSKDGLIVPNFEGKNISELQAFAAKHDLKVNVVNVDSDLEKGIIVAQFYKDKKATSGLTIQVAVSDGSKK